MFIAGQEPEDAHGNLVGPGDLAAQTRQVFANLGRALAACDARPGQVALHEALAIYRRIGAPDAGRVKQTLHDHALPAPGTCAPGM